LVTLLEIGRYGPRLLFWYELPPRRLAPLEVKRSGRARRLAPGHQLHQVALEFVGGADLLDVGVEIIRTTALREELSHRFVDQSYRLRVGALVLAPDHVLDAAAVDGGRVLGVPGAPQVGELQPQVTVAAALVRGWPASGSPSQISTRTSSEQPRPPEQSGPDEPIRLVPYDPAQPTRFAEERAGLEAEIG